MRFNSVDQWLQWQTDLHASAIDLGLERVREVAERLGLKRIAGKVVTVAGTNGKGSSVAAYEHWLRNAGFDVVSYTSPHLLRYNERIKRNLECVADSELCAAFEAVENARADTSLTYFEFGTLAALYLFQQWQPDFAVLEVGLGGRLDAVNIVDADLVHLTPIGIDHQAWLGDDRESIGFEKAGVLRAGIDVIVNDPDPPQSVLAEIERLGCRSLMPGRDYRVSDSEASHFVWQAAGRELRLSARLPGRHQQDNLAGVLAGLSILLDLAAWDDAQINAGFSGMALPGRFQRLAAAVPFQLYADVGHNPDAAAALASGIRALEPGGKVVVLLGMLADKQPAEFVEILAPQVDEWWLLTLGGERGQSALELKDKIGSQKRVTGLFENAGDAIEHALSSLRDQDIMLVTGSFVSVELLLRALPESDESINHGSEH